MANDLNITWDDEKPDASNVTWDDTPTKPKPTNTFGLTANPGIVEQFAGGAKHALDRAAAGLQAAAGAVGLPTGEPLAPLVQQGRQFVQQTGPASTVGQIAGDIALSAPVALKAFQGLKGALGLKAALAGDVGINAGYGALTADPGERMEGAAWGGGAAAAVPALGASLRALGKGAAHVLGGTTGAGAESVRQAYRDAPGFVENMRGHVAPGDVVEQARAGVQNMRNEMHKVYQANKAQWAGGKPLDFTPVADAYNNLASSYSHGGFSKVGPAEQRVLNEINEVLIEFHSRPDLHTTEGFDTLKQRLQAIYPENPQMRQAQRAVSTMTDAVKSTIVKQNPTYASAMNDYWLRSSHLDEIERSLSLGSKATTDTALRKLQSLMRNNVNSNFGQRVTSANALAAQGGQDVMPAVAGQAMNDWLPRGIGRGVGAAVLPPAVFSGGMGIPAAVGSALVQSPRIVGETARGIGKVGKVADLERSRMLVEALRRMLPASTRGLVGDGDAEPR